MNKEPQRPPDIERLTRDYHKLSRDLSLLRVQATKHASVLRVIADVLDGPESGSSSVADHLPKSADVKRLLETRAEVFTLLAQLKSSLAQAGVKLE